MDATKWFYVVGLISAIALGIGFASALVSLGLSWRINSRQKIELEHLKLDVAKQQERAANAERELELLKERTRPRGLTEAQLEDLRRHLQAIPDKIPIEIVTQDRSFPVTETSDLVGAQLATAFRQCGFEVFLKHHPKAPPVGIHLDVLFREVLTPRHLATIQPLIDFFASSPILCSLRQVVDSAYEHLTVRIDVGLDAMGR